MQESPEKYRLSTLKKSIIAISSVVLVEVIIGTIIGSLAILSDGLHALLDALTTIVLFFATRISIKPPDEEHMYGHEKFDSLGGLVGGLVLVGAAILIMFEAILRIIRNKSYINHNLEFAGFIAIAYTLFIDFYRVGTFSKRRKGESSTMKAGLYDAIADLGSTIIALAGFGLAASGIYFGDALASIFLSVMLSYLSVRLIWSSGMELSDATSKGVADKVRKEILTTKGVYGYKNLKIRKAGGKTFVRVTIQVPEFLNLEEAHDLSNEIEEKFKKILGNAEASIHIEPPETQTDTQKLVEEIATKVKGVIEAHEITAAYTEGKLYITLHAQVNPKLSVQETHDIAETIENEIFGTVKDVENVTVHIEPYIRESRKGLKANESEINDIIRKTAEDYQRAFKVRRILTYVANKKRYINIDGYFTKQISLEDAHSIASQIEEKIREHFEDTVVTVHMEPEPTKTQMKDSQQK